MGRGRCGSVFEPRNNALLKVNYDAGRDHIDMFLPFALDAIRSLDTDSFGLGQARSEIYQRVMTDFRARQELIQAA